jgi:hypothetical protein
VAYSKVKLKTKDYKSISLAFSTGRINPSTNDITIDLLSSTFIVVFFCVYVYTTLNWKLPTMAPSVNTSGNGVILN